MPGTNSVPSPEKRVAFIIARMGSSRLPAKQFRHISSKTMLEWIVYRLRRCAQLDEIVLATTNEAENDPLDSWCDTNGLPCFRYQGNVNHVTTRLRRAAEQFSTDICVLISGDCPLIQSAAIDQMVAALREDPQADMVRVEPNEKGMAPALQGVGVARKRAWQRADDLSTTDQLKEHHFPVMQQRPDLFTAVEIFLDDLLYDPFGHRYSIDTWADLEFHNALHETLRQQGDQYTLAEVMLLLRKKPRLLSINGHVHQKGVDERSASVLIVADAGKSYGYGHLMRTRELALQIIERLGWAVTFVVNDNHARNLLTEVGLRVIKTGEKDRETGQEKQNNLFADLLDNRTLDFCSSSDLILLDLSGTRTLPEGWRNIFPADCRVILLDRMETSSMEADLLIVPGVTGKWKDNFKVPETGGPEILAGREYVILRREIKRLQEEGIAKDIDLLVYLHHTQQREAVKRLTSKIDLNILVVEGFQQDFPGLLARSRMFLSGFGIAFYEALALGAYPITWAFSKAHEADAKLFYQRLNLLPFVVDSAEQLAARLPEFQKRLDGKTMGIIEDGTVRITGTIQSLFQETGP